MFYSQGTVVWGKAATRDSECTINGTKTLKLSVFTVHRGYPAKLKTNNQHQS